MPRGLFRGRRCVRKDPGWETNRSLVSYFSASPQPGPSRPRSRSVSPEARLVERRRHEPDYTSMDGIFDCADIDYFHTSIPMDNDASSNKNTRFLWTVLDILSIHAEYKFDSPNGRTQLYLIRKSYGFDLWIYRHNHRSFEKNAMRQNDLSALLTEWLE